MNFLWNIFTILHLSEWSIIMNDLVYKDKEIKIFHVQSELKNYNHKGVPYSNSLFAWEDNYNIEFNNNMYYMN